jgi:hypothetical protein
MNRKRLRNRLLGVLRFLKGYIDNPIRIDLCQTNTI